jgi:hypothetical protein
MKNMNVIKRNNKDRLKSQAGLALPMALILLVLASIIIIPGLWAMQSFLVINRDSETDTMGYYAADAGISDVIWRFNTRISPPFPYLLPNKVNGMDVTLTQVKAPVVDGPSTIYSVLSTARLGGKTISTIYAEMNVNTSVSPFDYAIATTGGDINIWNPANVTSNPPGHGDLFATGNIIITSPCSSVDGIKSATGTVSPSCSGSHPGSPPVTFNPLDTSWYLTEANKGGAPSCTPEIKGKTQALGPKHLNCDLTIKNSTITLTGPIWVDGNIDIQSSTINCSGNGYLIANGTGKSITTSSSTTLANTISLMSLNGNVSILNSTNMGTIYAPNGTVLLANNGTVYGSLIGKSVTISGSRTVNFQLSIGTPLPGIIASGTGAVLTRYSQ